MTLGWTCTQDWGNRSEQEKVSSCCYTAYVRFRREVTESPQKTMCLNSSSPQCQDRAEARQWEGLHTGRSRSTSLKSVHTDEHLGKYLDEECSSVEAQQV